MENDKTKWVWGLVGVVVIIGLILIARKGGKTETPVDNTEKTEVTETVTKEESPVAPAVTTKTTSTKPTTTTKTTTVKKPTGNVVQLTSKGFSPLILEVKVGESVEFLNSSDMAMIIHGATDKPENTYPGFSQESGPLGKGGKFFFAFTKAGAWSYYNLNSGLNTPKYQGIIIVK